MKIKVGDVVKKAVLTSKLSKVEILNKLGKSYPWLNTVLEDEYMQAKYVDQFGEILGIDFTQLIPDLSRAIRPSQLTEPIEPFGEFNNIKLRDTIIEIQHKYIVLLEEHAKLLKEFKNLNK